ncbi:class I SAM-dependent methyltransferase [Lacrimispora saccharolytica]|uniref:class I SAM-dependent methyltransferase n=1 Tax=Lacrimispora saccharolytica TaxID=84030 RepID=UPI0038CD823C
MGCGDGNQLSQIKYKRYVGVDVSQTIIEQNRVKFKDDNSKQLFCALTERALYIDNRYELAISMDVIFHLLEESVFEKYMEGLF